MSFNYDASQIGVPYVRANKITILYPDNGGMIQAHIDQTMAVKLADGSVRELQEITSFVINIDLASDGTAAIPIVDPSSGANLGMNTSLNSVMVQILAVIRKHQILHNI